MTLESSGDRKGALQTQITMQEQNLARLQQYFAQKQEQIQNKKQAELIGINATVGPMVDARAKVLAEKQSAVANAKTLLKNAETEAKDAAKSLAEAQIALKKTKDIQEKTTKTAVASLRKERNLAVKRIKREIKDLKNQIQAQDQIPPTTSSPASLP